RQEHVGRMDLLLRFLNEALPAPLRDLRHPGILRIYETCFNIGEPPYHVMELLWRSLAYRFRQGRLSLDLALNLGAQVAAALDLLHKRGIVHRDVKPANLMLSSADETPLVKLGDFGLAQFPPALEGAMPISTAEGTRMGTAEYMAPE